jgi:hypothetical protein
MRGYYLKRAGRFIVEANVAALREQVLLLGLTQLHADLITTTAKFLRKGRCVIVNSSIQHGKQCEIQD